MPQSKATEKTTSLVTSASRDLCLTAGTVCPSTLPATEKSSSLTRIDPKIDIAKLCVDFLRGHLSSAYGIKLKPIARLVAAGTRRSGQIFWAAVGTLTLGALVAQVFKGSE